MDKYLSAYTGPTPATGYVGYVNLTLKDDQVIFTVRPESERGEPTVCHPIPATDAIALLETALAELKATQGAKPCEN